MQIITNINQIKTGDCGLWHGHSFMAKEVQKFQKKAFPDYAAKYNHALMFVWIEGKLFCSEAVINGIQLTNFNHYHKELIEHPQCSLLCGKPQFQIKTDEVKELCLEASGTTHYDFVNLGFFQMVRMITKNKVWLGGKKVDDKFICGEWVAYNFNKFTDFYDNEKRISPAEIYLSSKLDKLEIKL